MTALPAALDRTRRDYDSQTARYVTYIDDPANAEPMSRALIGAFADLVLADAAPGVVPRVLDAGCGPGQWADRLDRSGLLVRGVDLAPAMVAAARARRPDLVFEPASLLDLPDADDSLHGVLVHFSLIHTPPALVPVALAEIARVLAPGGHLLLGGFALDGADSWLAFDHRVSPAFRWSPAALADLLGPAGLGETARVLLPVRPGGRFPGVYLFARRPS